MRGRGRLFKTGLAAARRAFVLANFEEAWREPFQPPRRQPGSSDSPGPRPFGIFSPRSPGAPAAPAEGGSLNLRKKRKRKTGAPAKLWTLFPPPPLLPLEIIHPFPGAPVLQMIKKNIALLNSKGQARANGAPKKFEIAALIQGVPALQRLSKRNS